MNIDAFEKNVAICDNPTYYRSLFSTTNISVNNLNKELNCEEI